MARRHEACEAAVGVPLWPIDTLLSCIKSLRERRSQSLASEAGWLAGAGMIISCDTYSNCYPAPTKQEPLNVQAHVR